MRLLSAPRTRCAMHQRHKLERLLPIASGDGAEGGVNASLMLAYTHGTARPSVSCVTTGWTLFVLSIEQVHGASSLSA